MQELFSYPGIDFSSWFKSVRKDHKKLTDKAKLLYQSLLRRYMQSNSNLVPVDYHGLCKEFECTSEHIRRLIVQLEEAGLVARDFKRDPISGNIIFNMLYVRLVKKPEQVK